MTIFCAVAAMIILAIAGLMAGAIALSTLKAGTLLYLRITMQWLPTERVRKVREKVSRQVVPLKAVKKEAKG